MKNALILAATMLIACDPSTVPLPDHFGTASSGAAASTGGGGAGGSSLASSGSGGGAMPGDGASGTRLHRTRVDGADGSKVYDGGLFDTLLDVRCGGLPVPDGERCMPLGAAVIVPGYFADSSCTIRAASLACGVPLYAMENTGPCPAVWRFYAIGPKVSQVYVKLNGTCSQTSTSYAYYEVAAEVNYADFVKLDRVVE